MNRYALAIALVFSAGACSSWKEPSGSGASARALALKAARATLDSGGYEILVDQAVASAFSIAKVRLEAGGTMVSTVQLQRVETAIRQTIVQVYPRSLWEEAVQALYFDNLYPEDLRRLLAFQRSRTGRKVLRIQAQLMSGPDIMREVMEPRQVEYAQRLARALRAIFQDSVPR